MEADRKIKISVAKFQERIFASNFNFFSSLNLNLNLNLYLKIH